jgi:hypothetical protein
VYSKFSGVCSALKTSNPLPTIDLFLALYEDALKWKTVAECVVTNVEDEAFLEKSATQWVDATLAIDLEVLKLLNGDSESFSRTKRTNIAKFTTSVELPRTSVSKKQPVGASAKVQSKVSPSCPVSCTWSATRSMKETVELARIWNCNGCNKHCNIVSC